jgi:HD superfamily phosphohydrolase
VSITAIAGSPWGLPAELLNGSYRTFQDPIHGAIWFSELEAIIIDWGMFQRLGYIALNTGADAAYPNDTAPRRAHCLGAVAAFQTLFGAVTAGDRWRTGEPTLFCEWRDTGEWELHRVQAEILGRLIALLHDLLHLPGSHWLEDVFGLFERHDAARTRFDLVWSTLPEYLDSLVELGRLTALQRALLQATLVQGALYQELRAGILSKVDLGHRPLYPWIGQLVNGFPGADVLDYLQRDNYNAGRPHQIDTRWIRAVTVTPRSDPRFPEQVAWRVYRKGQVRREILDSLVAIQQARLDNLLYLYRHDRVLRKVAMVAKAVEGLLAHRRELDAQLVAGTNADVAAQLPEVEQVLLERGEEGTLWYLAERWEAERALCNSEAAERRLRAVSALARDVLRGRLFADQIVCEDLASAYPLRERFGESEARAGLEALVARDNGLDGGDVILMIPPVGMKGKNPARLLLIDGDHAVPASESQWAAKLTRVPGDHEEAWAAQLFVRRCPAYHRDKHEGLARSLTHYTQAMWHVR